MDPLAIRRAYDVSAGDYDRRFLALQTPKYDAILSRLDVPSAARVADLGGGTGLLLASLPPLARPPVVLDFSFPMLGLAPRGAHRVQGDLRRLPLRSGSIDRAFAVTSLLLSPRLRSVALLELRRVLAPDGRLALTVLADEAAGLEGDLRAAGLRPGPSFPCGQDLGWLCS